MNNPSISRLLDVMKKKPSDIRNVSFEKQSIIYDTFTQINIEKLSVQEIEMLCILAKDFYRKKENANRNKNNK